MPAKNRVVSLFPRLTLPFQKPCVSAKTVFGTRFPTPLVLSRAGEPPVAAGARVGDVRGGAAGAGRTDGRTDGRVCEIGREREV